MILYRNTIENILTLYKIQRRRLFLILGLVTIFASRPSISGCTAPCHSTSHVIPTSARCSTTALRCATQAS